ncbi:MAG: mandelate racemase [Pseudolabrys sp.]
MADTPPRLSLLDVTACERPVTLRLPFRFGVVTLREAPQLFVRVRIKLQDGREGDGISAELLVPKWFDKAPELTNEDNFDQLRRSLASAARHMKAAGQHTAFGLTAAANGVHRAACENAGLNGLVASFGQALVERAIIDALGRLENAPASALVRANRLGIDTRLTPDLAGFDLDGFLSLREPAVSINVRHTVGLLDALTRDATKGQRLDDGLPESLEEVIAAYGHRYFKLKVAGKIDADLERLAGIAAVLDRQSAPYHVTLDGNEQYEEVGAVIELWRRIGEDKRLARLKASILLLEQPIARSRALSEPIRPLGDEVPVEVDESDADFDVFPRARALGYRGISAKSCKGFYRALLNAARVAKLNDEMANSRNGARCFMSAEDLTTQGGIAVQQDLMLATLVGATHVERNGHHYVDGMAGAPTPEQDAFLAAHGDLYRRAPNGRARLDIRDGMVSLGSIARAAGLASAVIPDFTAMRESAIAT